MHARHFLWCGLFFGVAFVPADEKKPAPPLVTELAKTTGLEPNEAVKSFQLHPGFRMELVTSEPLIRDPVAIDFDEDGRLFVVECPEYNDYASPKPTNQHGCVKRLVDTDGDGRYDQSTIYVKDVDTPVAVACWDGGIYVGIVPDLWYFKDTNNDGVADIKRRVLTGFDRDRAGEAMLNSFRWGPDNRFHISTGLAGGQLRVADDPQAKSTLVRRQNIRFDPRTHQFEPTSGGGQHGMTLDDWGNTFVCDNSNPIEYLTYDARYILRNPYVVAPSPLSDVNTAGRYLHLGRISPPEPWREVRTRLRKNKLVPGSDEGGVPFGFFTGATGVTIYTGDAYPKEFRGNVFVGEVANNLLYRAILEPKGLTWAAVRAEKDREFLASRDIWFRPVQLANSPDGCLYVVDMYRELIEGGAFLPKELLSHMNVMGGQDQGRIWRIVPEKWNRRPLPKLSTATGTELVKLLEHPNGWHRRTAARLLYQRQDRATVPALRAMAKESASDVARMLALRALEGMKQLQAMEVAHALNDASAHVVEQALRMAEGFELTPDLAKQLTTLVRHPSERVRLQLAFTLGTFPRGHAAWVVPQLKEIARHDGDQPLVRFAVLCSANETAGELFAALLSDAKYRNSADGKLLITALTAQIASANRADEIATVVQTLNALPDEEKALAGGLIRTLLTKLPASAQASLAKLRSGRTGAVLHDLLQSARRTVADEKAAPANRAAAVRTLGLAPFVETKDLLANCLDVRQPVPVQLAALDVLARQTDLAVPKMILAAWVTLSPQLRAGATETILSRPTWANAFLDAVEKGTVRRSDIDPARVQILQKSPDETIRNRATKLFAGNALSKRGDVIAKYLPALQLKGDVAKGKVVFKDVCSSCHRLDNVGQAVGPDLRSIKNRGTDAVLTNVLDPNREVLPQYYTYLITTDSGVSLSGMITAETANTLTLRKADGTSETLQRVNIETLRSSGLSAMPEGLEEKLTPQTMADLLAYLGSIK